jgi:hypothetical protein
LQEKKEKKEYLKAKIDEPETNIMIKNIRDLYRGNSEFKNVRTNTVKDEKGDLLRDCHSALAWCRNNFPQLLNVHGVSAVRQTELHTAEPRVRKPSAFELEMALEKLKRHRLPGIDQILAELIKAGGRTIRSEIHKLINSIWNKKELFEEWKESIIVPINKKCDKRDCSNYRGISILPTTYKILSSILLSRLTPYAAEIIGDHQCGF